IGEHAGDLLLPRRLSGRTVLITRAAEQAAELTALLELEGARVLQGPSIEIRRIPEKIAELQTALRNHRNYDWLIVTSTNTVEIIQNILREMGESWKLFSGLRIACIGESTAQRVQQAGGAVSLVPPHFQAESLVEELLKTGIKNKRLLLPRAAASREILPR